MYGSGYSPSSGRSVISCTGTSVGLWRLFPIVVVAPEKTAILGLSMGLSLLKGPYMRAASCRWASLLASSRPSAESRLLLFSPHVRYAQGRREPGPARDAHQGDDGEGIG